MSDFSYPLFPIFAFFGFFLPLIPLPWHLLAYNSGTCYFIMWSSLASLNQLVNSIVWKGNVTNWTPWWCEISIRIMLASSYPRRVNNKGRKAKRGFCRFADLRVVASCFYYLQYVIQGHRFNIYEDIGCFPALYNTPLLYVLNPIWPILLGLISATYCVLSLRAFMQRRAEFSQFLASNKSLTMNRYFRLMALSMTEICCTTPLAVLMIFINAFGSPVSPWRSWADTYFDYGRITQVPALFWRSNYVAAIGLEATRGVTVICSLIFFVFFGFADEARRNYGKWIKTVTGLFSSHIRACAHESEQKPPLKPLMLPNAYSKSLPPTPPPMYSTFTTCGTGSVTHLDSMSISDTDLEKLDTASHSEHTHDRCFQLDLPFDASSRRDTVV